MTPKQILDSFSETLMQDERILSAQERSLVAALLQHAKSSTMANEETREAVQAVIASAVGETVAQRAFAVLGGSIVECILAGSPFAADGSGGRSTDLHEGLNIEASTTQPQPPNKSPGPGVKAPVKEPQKPMRDSPVPPGQPQPPNQPLRTPGVPSSPGQPQPPNQPLRTPGVPSSPGQPQPPNQPLRTPVSPSPAQPQPPNHGIRTTVVSQAQVAVVERPAILPAKCVVLEEFLAPQEVDELTRFTLEHESDFSASEVISPVEEGGVVNYEHRRSRVLMELEHHQDVMLNRILGVLPEVLRELGMEEFSIADVEMQVTASNDGDFFHFHSDNSSDRVASRHLTFVYFFHREPRRFEGGELRIHDARLKEDSYVSAGSYQSIVPRQNQIVFFPCELLHEITAVTCPSGQFADSRFTLNGWLRH
jgi:Rps23 Pro-64 3,4-dihydroxylase Tpa1-like proline 4-hydroxylase